jgi:PadR family transcriptional regulator
MTRRDILPGMLDMLILQTLSAQPLHGYGIARELREQSKEVIQVEEGSLYPALLRMRQKGWVRTEWRQTPNRQRARYYEITMAGRGRLGEMDSAFADLVTAVRRIKRSSPGNATG